MPPLRILLIVLTVLAVPAAHARGLFYASLDSAFLVKGEVTRLTLTVEGETRPSSLPTFVPNPDLTIRPIEEGLRILPNRKRVFSYSYSVQSFTEGTHQIPVFKIMVGASNL